MKSLLKISTLLMVILLCACEKNDPLADQGELTGFEKPFNLLAQMPDAAAGDTITLRTVCWAVNDDIETVELFHEGFKLRTFDVLLSIEVADGTIFEINEFLEQDTIFVAQQLIAQYPEEGGSLLDHYQTLENAYVILHDFIVPEIYALTKATNEELIMKLDDTVFDLIVAGLSEQFNRAMMITVFPDINQFSLVFFLVDDDGFFTGEITEEAELYIQENMTRELLIDFLKEAKATDNTRVTVESVATLENNIASTSSERTFRVL